MYMRKQADERRNPCNQGFFANLVTEELPPLADYFGRTDSYKCDKSKGMEVEKGKVLEVLVLVKSPCVYELEVTPSIALGDSDVFLCNVRNVLHDETLCNETLSIKQKLNVLKIVTSVCTNYFDQSGNLLGSWCEPMKKS